MARKKEINGEKTIYIVVIVGLILLLVSGWFGGGMYYGTFGYGMGGMMGYGFGIISWLVSLMTLVVLGLLIAYLIKQLTKNNRR